MTTKSPNVWWHWRSTAARGWDIFPSWATRFEHEDPIDYRSRVATNKTNWPAVQRYLEDAYSETDLSLVQRPSWNRGFGTMTTIAYFPRPISQPLKTYSTMIVMTPPLYHIASVCFEKPTARDRNIWMQPWLYATGRGGLFWAMPETSSNRRMVVLDSERFMDGEVSDQISVAADAFLQTGKPDPRFL